jgi:dihydrofolate reductase
MAITGIVAVAKNLAIGRGGKLPWHYPADLKFFKQTTTSHAVVMGYNTYVSIGKPLPNRLNIVLSRTKNIENQPDVKLLRSKEEVLEFARGFDRDIYIIGGAKTFETFTDVMEKWIVTEIPLMIEDADTFISESLWEGFTLTDVIPLDDDLQVKIFERRANGSEFKL